MENKTRQLKNIPAILVKSHWEILVSLVSLLYLFLLKFNIANKYNLLAYLVACFLILFFEFITYISGYYLQNLLKEKKNEKAYSNLNIFIIIILGILNLLAIAFLKSASSKASFYIIITLLPINLNLYSRANLKNSLKVTLKILKIFILLLYPVFYFSLNLNIALCLVLFSWLILFIPMILLSEIEVYKLDKKLQTRIYKTTLFLLICAPLSLGFLANLGVLSKIYIFISLPILYILKIIKTTDIDTEAAQSMLLSDVKTYIYLQIIVAFILNLNSG